MTMKTEAWQAVRVLDHGRLFLRDSMPHWSHVPHDRCGDQFGPGDSRICEAARVSNDFLPKDVREAFGLEAREDNRTLVQDLGLINYLMTNKHTTPIEQVKFTFVVRLPITVARQWIRYRSGVFNEQSARYSQLPNEFYLPSIERFQEQSKSNKQASGASLPREMAVLMRKSMFSHQQLSYRLYEKLLADGLARETARNVLPPSVYTEWYWSVDLHNLMHFLRQRLHEHAQWEVRQYAQAILPMVRKVAPATMAVFEKTL